MADDDLPHVLTGKGAAILKRGGADGMSDDDMLVLEILARVPGASMNDVAAFFVALRTEYGEEALRAIRTGHVQFEKRQPQ
jgi:hypothetical protein